MPNQASQRKIRTRTTAVPSGPSSSVLDQLLQPNFSLDVLVRDLIQHALSKAAGNKTIAARLLGLSRRRLYSRLESKILLNPDPPQPL